MKKETLRTVLLIVLIVLIVFGVVIGLATCQKNDPAGPTGNGESKTGEASEPPVVLTGVELKPGETPIILLPDSGEPATGETPSSSSSQKAADPEPSNPGVSSTSSKGTTEPEPTQPTSSSSLIAPPWSGGSVETPLIPFNKS